MRVPGTGGPRSVLAAALEMLEREGLALERVSPQLDNAAIGPSARRFANAAALVRSDLSPPDLMVLLQQIEAAFGRRRRGQRWRARPLDIDIILFNGGPWVTPGLIIPHREFHNRAFVLAPAMRIAARWRDPVTGLTIRHLHARLTRPRPLPR